MATNEWYTPAKYAGAVRAVLGEIDLDPASCARANHTIQARKYHTIEDNGLMHPWHGRVYLNPPYGKTLKGGRSNLEVWTRYLVAQYTKGNVSEAILLIPCNMGTSWFPLLWQYPICFPDFRIRFDNEQGKSDGASFGTCFIYLGTNESRFIEVFSKYGYIVRAIAGPDVYVREELWTA